MLEQRCSRHLCDELARLFRRIWIAFHRPVLRICFLLATRRAPVFDLRPTNSQGFLQDHRNIAKILILFRWLPIVHIRQKVQAFVRLPLTEDFLTKNLERLQEWLESTHGPLLLQRQIQPSIAAKTQKKWHRPRLQEAGYGKSLFKVHEFLQRRNWLMPPADLWQLLNRHVLLSGPASSIIFILPADQQHSCFRPFF